jgi:hypothetical protein
MDWMSFLCGKLTYFCGLRAKSSSPKNTDQVPLKTTCPCLEILILSNKPANNKLGSIKQVH